MAEWCPCAARARNTRHVVQTAPDVVPLVVEVVVILPLPHIAALGLLVVRALRLTSAVVVLGL